MSITNTTHLRIARPTDHLTEVTRFYRDGLGFEVIASFDNHDGFDGVMLALKGAAYHLEFTSKAGHQVGRALTEDNLLVFYLPDAQQWKQAVARVEKQGGNAVMSFNPYWDYDYARVWNVGRHDPVSAADFRRWCSGVRWYHRLGAHGRVLLRQGTAPCSCRELDRGSGYLLPGYASTLF